ncbi:MAG TPA: hypothetical protein VE620_04755 [Myxococcales bacterium]|nr:hypothetical protein [Myxococcales bacterium]
MTGALTVLLLLASAATPDAGTPQPSRVRVTVRAIAATSGTEQIDPKLKPIAKNLAEFSKDFRYRNFQLASEQTLDLPFESAAQAELPGSRSLQITPRQMAADGRIKVHLELLGEHPAHSRKLHTDYTIQRGGTIFVGGLRLDPQKPDRGMLLIAVTQEIE